MHSPLLFHSKITLKQSLCINFTTVKVRHTCLCGFSHAKIYVCNNVKIVYLRKIKKGDTVRRLSHIFHNTKNIFAQGHFHLRSMCAWRNVCDVLSLSLYARAMASMCLCLCENTCAHTFCIFPYIYVHVNDAHTYICIVEIRMKTTFSSSYYFCVNKDLVFLEFFYTFLCAPRETCRQLEWSIRDERQEQKSYFSNISGKSRWR